MKDSTVRFLLFLTGRIFFGRGKFVPKKSKLFVEAEIWNLGELQYVEFNGDFPSFTF